MIYFLIPVYNEEKNLERLFNDTSKDMLDAGYSDFRYIFVDDGSTDTSLRTLKKFAENNESVIVLSHKPNAGVKQTFMDGFNEFLRVSVKGDMLITKEADNTSDNSILNRMIESISKNEADVVLASCYKKGGGVEGTNLYRKILSSSANLLIKIRFNMWGLHTFSSFYRAFSYECLEKAFAKNREMMTYEGFTCVVEMLIKINKMNFRIKEVPMVLRSTERVGTSKMPILKTIRGYLRLCLFGVKIDS